MKAEEGKKEGTKEEEEDKGGEDREKKVDGRGGV